jgi:hypothetical protein
MDSQQYYACHSRDDAYVVLRKVEPILTDQIFWAVKVVWHVVKDQPFVENYPNTQSQK